METILIFFLFLTSAFFSGSETSLMSVNKMKLKTRADNGDKKAERVLKLVEKPEKLLTTILVGNNFVNIYLTALVTSLSIRLFGESSITYATVILTIALLIFSEITPKSIAAIFSERISIFVTPFIFFFMFLLSPISFVLSKFTNIIIHIITKGKKQDEKVSIDEIKTMVNIASSEGVFESEDKKLINGVLDFKNKGIKDALKTPRVDIVGIPKNSSFEEVRQYVLDNNYSRYPVYNNSIDEIVGIFNAKSLIEWSSDVSKNFSDYIDTDILFVLETINIDKVFERMKENKKHIAIVVDEYGGTEGLVSLEDILETLIGQEINDETDEDEQMIEYINENHIIAKGHLSIRNLNDNFGSSIPDEFDTLSGFIISQLENKPEKGDILYSEGIELKILQFKNNRVLKVEIKNKKPL